MRPLGQSVYLVLAATMDANPLATMTMEQKPQGQ